jgi:hypothetical protein
VAKKKLVDDDGIPFMTDNMKRALDTGTDLPIEQFVSNDGMSQMEMMKAARSAPVRMDSLQPMSKTEARRRMTFDGEHLPAAPATRRVIPKPFQRERIDLGGHGKTWQTVQATHIQREDIIPDVGLVTDVQEGIRHEQIAGQQVAVGTFIVVEGAGGNLKIFDDTRSLVRVFREAAEQA